MIAPGGLEPLPRVRKLVPNVEEGPSVSYPALCDFVGGAAEHVAALARRVVQVENQIAQRVQVEEVILRRKLDAPSAYRTEELEWQVAFVTEVEFEHSAVVLSA